MNYLSVCSGIEAATVAWHPIGWNAFSYSEIEPFPSAVLAHHYPNTPNFGDMTKFKEWPDAAIDLLVGGTPCQSFSVAGLRKGLADPRGNLMLTYLAIADKYRPKWLVWENVPGVLSSNGGRDFGTLLGGLGQLGYGFAYRVLDAQYFGVAQRRRRVFVVGCLGGWRSAAAVLFERHSLQGHPPPSRKAGQEIAGTITAGAFSGGASGRPEGAAGNHFIASTGDIAHCLNAGGMGRQDYETETMIVHGTQDPCISTDTAFALGRNNGAENALAFGIQANIIGRQDHNGGNGLGYSEECAPTLTKNDQHAAAMGMQVRRLTPVECERLQGFPDDYTAITRRGKPPADGPRYKALGNSMAVPVMRWIGERISMVEALDRIGEAA